MAWEPAPWEFWRRFGDRVGMRRVFEVVLVILLVAVGARLFSGARPPAPVPATSTPVTRSPLQAALINGLAFDDSRERAEYLLGKPSCEGRLKVGKQGEEDGSYAEWGGSPRLTWNGSPTVTFWANGRILSTIGSTLVAAGHELTLGSSEAEVLEAFGPPTRLEDTAATYEASGLTLHLTYNSQRKLTRILRESVR